jgi:hypothetical protein
MIVGYKPRGNSDIAAAEPVVAYLHPGKVFGPLYALYVSVVSIIQIVVARNKIHLFKIVIHVLQCLETVVQRDNVETGSIVVPVAQEQAGLATLFSGLGRGPLHKVQAVLVVLSAVAFESKMYVCEDRGLAK